MRRSKIDIHDAITLLRVLLCHPGAVYARRAGPSFYSPALAIYDEELRDCAADCLNVRLDGKRWKQATLPPIMGGLGLRLHSELALQALMSACTSVSSLASQLCNKAPDHDAPRALALRHAIAGDAAPPSGHRHVQP